MGRCCAQKRSLSQSKRGLREASGGLGCDHCATKADHLCIGRCNSTGGRERCRASFCFSNKKHKVLYLIDKEECEVQIIDSKNYWDFIVFSDTFRQIQKAMPCRKVEDFPRKLPQTLHQPAGVMRRVRIVLVLLTTMVATM